MEAVVGEGLHEVEPGVPGSSDPAVHQDLCRPSIAWKVVSRSGRFCGALAPP